MPKLKRSSVLRTACYGAQLRKADYKQWNLTQYNDEIKNIGMRATYYNSVIRQKNKSKSTCAYFFYIFRYAKSDGVYY